MPRELTSTRAAICIPCLLTGGTEVASLDLACALSSFGLQVSVIVYFDEVDPSMAATFEAAGIRIVRLDCERREAASAWIRLALYLSRAVREGRYGLIWVQYMTPTLIPLLVTRLATRNLISAVHCAPQHFDLCALKRLRWLAQRWCTRFVCVSKATANGIFGNIGSAWAHRVAIVPNTIADVFSVDSPPRMWRKECGWNSNTLVVGYLGRLVPLKGADVLIRAFKALMSRRRDLRLVIVGEGDGRALMEAAVEAVGLRPFASFIGKVTRAEVASAVRGFDILVVPSRQEGFGLSALEGMAAGVPVVASRVGALPELILDNEAGLLFDVDDAAGLAELISELADNGSLRRRLGEAGRARAQGVYGWEVYRERIGALLTDLSIIPARRC